MALAFNQASGKAVKNKLDMYQYKNGDNKVRIVGGILPRYLYWVKGTNNKDIPFECLAFNSTTETFDNSEVDYVRKYFPDLKCNWSYAILCIDPSDGKVKVLNLKRKLLEQIKVAAEDLGDPTDPETGWAVCFKRTKTGPAAFNVEYQLQPLKCKSEPLTEEERAAVAESKTIDELLPRPTPEQQRQLLESIINSVDNDADGNDAVPEEFNQESEDDIKF